MSDNTPTLYKNIMSGLPSDFARDVFLWAVDMPGNDRMCYKAERFAREADQLIRGVGSMLDMGARQHGLNGHDADLMGFILKRHANWRMGGNVSPPYATN